MDNRPLTQTSVAPQSSPSPGVAPRLQFSIPCSEVDYKSGKAPILHSVFHEVPYPGELTQASFHIVNGWIGGAKGQDWKQEIKILKPDGSVHLASGLQPLEFVDANTPFMAVNFFPDIPFDRPGLYPIVISLNSQEKLRYPLVVRGSWFRSCSAK